MGMINERINQFAHSDHKVTILKSKIAPGNKISCL